MAFDEVTFPVGISLGATIHPRHSTAVVVVDSGAYEATSRWTGALREYDAGLGIRNRADAYSVYNFALARLGPARGFRWKDWLDYTSNAADGATKAAPTDQALGTGDGSTATFQLVKKYTSGGQTRTRNITKPVSGTVRIAYDNVEQASGFTVDTTTGIVTFTVAPSLNVVIAAGFEFDVPVRFLDDPRFALANRKQGGLPSIPIVEIASSLETAEDYPYGGAAFTTISANAQLALADGVVRQFATTTLSLQVILPDVANLVAGGPYFYIGNDSTSTQSFTIRKTSGGTTVATVAAGSAYELWLGLDSGGAKKWYAL